MKADLLQLGELLVVVFGAFGGLLVGFYSFATKQMKDSRIERIEELKAFSDALALLGKGQLEVAQSNRSIAEETKALREETAKGNQQSEQRNGHLGELILKQGEQTKSIVDHATKTIVGAFQNVREQHVQHTTIENETVIRRA